jgi:hypothetical protein
MGMAPDEYLEAFVEGNFIDYAEDPGSVRRAFNVAVSASHLADHYFEFNRKNHPERVKQFKSLGDFVEFISERTGGAFRDIRSISNAYKHLYTEVDPRKAVHSSVASTGAVDCITFNYQGSDLNEIEEHYETGTPGTRVVYRRKDGQLLEFLPAIEKVRKFWDEFLYAQRAQQP